MLVVVDIDGTIADIMHRTHYIKTKPKNYDAFNNASSLDKPEKETIELVNALRHAGHDVIFASGRSEDNRGQTLDWMENHVGTWVRNVKTYMRKSKDFRSDTIVKEEILAEIQADFGQKPDMAIDDRLGVCQMWHRNGIRVCRMGNPDLDNNFNVRD